MAVFDPPPAEDLLVLRAWLAERLPLLRSRAALLAEWHDEVSGATTQLHPELIRYADVIAATSIGAASRPELSDVDFDLAIVDEAGQIGMADVLVPLVRATRGPCWWATTSSCRRSSTPRWRSGARASTTRSCASC